MAYGSYEEALLAELYPGWLAFYNVDPAVRWILNVAAKERWTDDKIKANVRNTAWWKRTPASAREALHLELMDPADWSNQVGNRADQLRVAGSKLGLNLPAHIRSWYAATGFKNGLTDEQILERMVMEQSPKTGKAASGLLGETYAQIKGQTREWGVPVGDTEAWYVAKHVVAGRGDEAWINDFMRDKALKQYKGNKALEAAITDGGMTVREFAAPYIDMAARELEMNPAMIDIANPGYRKAFHHRDANGVLGPMEQGDWQTHLRTDGIFGAIHDQTKAAKTEAVQMVDELERTFGTRG